MAGEVVADGLAVGEDARRRRGAGCAGEDGDAGPAARAAERDLVAGDARRIERDAGCAGVGDVDERVIGERDRLRRLQGARVGRAVVPVAGVNVTTTCVPAAMPVPVTR